MIYKEIELTKKSYDLHGVNYSIYQDDNKFKGTPVPESYEAIYLEDLEDLIPASLQLNKLI